MHLQALQHQHLVGEGLLDEATEGEIVLSVLAASDPLLDF